MDDDMDFLDEKPGIDDTTRKSIENELRVLDLTKGVHGVIEYYEVSYILSSDSRLKIRYTLYSRCFKAKSCSP